MLQLLFLVVHSQAQHHEAQQALAQQDSSAFPTSTMRHTTSCHSGVAPASAFQLAKEEVDTNMLDLATCLSEFTHQHTSATHLLPDVLLLLPCRRAGY